MDLRKIRALLKRMARSTGGHPTTHLAALVVLCAGLHWAGPVFVPFLMALFVAMLSGPIVHAMTTRRVPRPLAVLMVIVLDVVVISFVSVMFVSALTSFYDAWPRYQVRFEEIVSDAAAWLQARGFAITAQSIYDSLDANAAVSIATQAATRMATVVGNLVVVLLIVAFLLLESTVLSSKLSMILRDPERDIERFAGIAKDVQKYLFVKTLTSLSTAVLVGVIVTAFRIDFPLLWALFAFFLNFLPSVGSIIAGGPPFVLALVQYDLPTALAFLAIYTAVNFVIGNVIEPRVMGRTLGLSAVVVFVSMLFWGWLWGPVGAFLAVPLTMTAKIILSYTDDLRWVAVLIGAPPHPKEVELALSMRPPKMPSVPPNE